MYKIYVRDKDLNRVAEVDDYHSLDLIPRFNNPGSWALDLPIVSDAAKEIVKQKSGVIVQKDGQTIFSGPVTSRKRMWNADEDKITVTGYDDLIYIYRSLAYPVPLGPPYTSQAYDIRTGVAETIIKQFVDVNIGPNARSDRRIQNLILQPDQGLGKTVTGRARFHSLIELFRMLALAGGDLGFRIVQVDKSLEFQVYQPSDKTKEVVFSPLLGNLIDFEYLTADPDTNYVVVGGGGEGTARTILERGDSTSISKYGRIESFVDRRDTTDQAELEQSLNEELAQKAERTGLSIVPIDIEGTSFNANYNLGDKVSVILTQPKEIVDTETLNYFLSVNQPSEEERTRIYQIQEKLEVIKDVIREVKITLTPSGENISPMIGTPDITSNSILGIFDKMKQIQRRMSNLERR